MVTNRRHGERTYSFLGRIDGSGGFAVVETDDPALIARDVSILARSLT